MAGTRYGGEGIISFFSVVADYFDFTLCNNEAPTLI